MLNAGIYREAQVRSVTVSVLRRSGSTFSPIGVDGSVKPGEPVRYLGRGISFQTIAVPEFTVVDQYGNVHFRFSAGANIQGDAWVDTVAPEAEGKYVLILKYQSYPFLGFTTKVSTEFLVSGTAPKPPSEPPSKGLFESMEGLLKWTAIGAIAIGGVMIVSNLIRKKS